MRKLIIARMESYGRLGRLLSDNIAVYTDFGKLNEQVTAFSTHVSRLENYGLQQTNGTTPATTAKDLHFDLLESLTLNLSKKGRAWANATGENEDAVFFDIGLNDFNGAEESRIMLAQNIFNALTERLPRLTAFRVTEANLETLESAITEARRLKAIAGNGRTRRSNAGLSLQNEVRESEKILDIIQDLLESEYGASHPDFVSDFVRTRRIDNPVTRHTRVRGIVKNASGQPLAGALCRLEELDRPVSTSDPSGRFELKSFRGGDHVLLVSKEGYAPFVLSIHVSPGDTLEPDVTLTSTGS